MEHPKLVVWFDDIEDAVTTAFSLTMEQRALVKVLRAPRPDTWVMLAQDTETRNVLRNRLTHAQRLASLPVAGDCQVLEGGAAFLPEDDTFDRDNGFSSIEIEYIEEGSAEALMIELTSDADDYAASEETGWFYAITDGEDNPNPEAKH